MQRSNEDTESEDEQVRCIIDEANLNFNELKMVKKNNFPKYTLANCVAHCLQHWPDHEYILISYADDIFTSDDFKCMCANKKAFAENQRLQEYKCNNMCPESNDKYR